VNNHPRVHLHTLLPGERFTCSTFPDDAVYTVVESSQTVKGEIVPVNKALGPGGSLLKLADVAHANGGSYFVFPVKQESRP
jgi:hypothetical protein